MTATIAAIARPLSTNLAINVFVLITPFITLLEIYAYAFKAIPWAQVFPICASLFAGKIKFTPKVNVAAKMDSSLSTENALSVHKIPSMTKIMEYADRPAV